MRWGPLRIDVEVRGAVVDVRFAATTSEVVRKIDEALPLLRSTLEDQGLKVGQVTTRLATEQMQGRGAEPAADPRSSHDRDPAHAGWDGARGREGGGSPSGQHSPGHEGSYQDFLGGTGGRGGGGSGLEGFEGEGIQSTERIGRAPTLDLLTLRLDAVA